MPCHQFSSCWTRRDMVNHQTFLPHGTQTRHLWYSATLGWVIPHWVIVQCHGKEKSPNVTSFPLEFCKDLYFVPFSSQYPPSPLVRLSTHMGFLTTAMLMILCYICPSRQITLLSQHRSHTAATELFHNQYLHWFPFATTIHGNSGNYGASTLQIILNCQIPFITHLSNRTVSTDPAFCPRLWLTLKHPGVRRGGGVLIIYWPVYMISQW